MSHPTSGPTPYGSPNPQGHPNPYGSPDSFGSPNPYGTQQQLGNAPHFQSPGPEKNGYGVTALVLGIIGIILGFIPFAGIAISLLLGCVGVILGVLGIRRVAKGLASNKAMSIIGTTLSALSIFVGIGGLVLTLLIFGAIGSAAEESRNDPIGSSGSSRDSGGSNPNDNPAPAPTSSEARYRGQLEKDVVGDAGTQLTINDVSIMSTPLTKESGIFGEYYCTDISVTNNRTDTLTGFGPYDFTLQNPAGSAADADYSGIDGELESSDIAPGGSASGKVCFDQTKATSGDNVVLYKAAFDFSDERGAWVNSVP